MPCAAFSAKGNGYHLGAGIVERGLFCFFGAIMNTQPALEPVDKTRCQADIITNPSFMQIGGRRKVERCTIKPVIVATEAKPGSDGLQGAMSLCANCLIEFQKKMGADFATYEAI
jgi:hypothetical protein